MGVSCDVLVVGGGPAGAATALALAGHGRRVVLVESTRYDRPRLGDTLAPEVRGSLRRLGVGHLADAAGNRAYGSIRAAWGSAEAEETSLLFRPWGAGFHVDRNRFDAALAAAAAEAGVELCIGTRVTAVEADADTDANGWRAGLSDGVARRPVRTRWLVDASGRCPALAPRVGRRFLADDRLVGLARYVRAGGGDDDGGDHLLLEAVAAGWWSSAPLADGRLSVVLMTDADLVQGQPGGAAAFWARQIERAELTRRRLGRAAVTGTPTPGTPTTVRPARSGRLDRLLAPGFLAVGDAAAAFDPLSGFGVAKALEDGLAAAAALHAALAGDDAPLTAWAAGVESAYRNYLTARAAYYLRQPRWPTAPFWARRRRLDPRRVPVVLDPNRRLAFLDNPAARDGLRELAPLLPGVPLAELAELAREPAPAHRLAAAFLARRPDPGGDDERAVVVALQLLAQRRILV